MYLEIRIFILSQWTEGVVSRQSVAFGWARTCQLHLIKQPDKGERWQAGLRKSFIQCANGPEYKSFFNIFYLFIFFVTSRAREYFCSALLNIHIQEIARGFVPQADKNLTDLFSKNFVLWLAALYDDMEHKGSNQTTWFKKPALIKVKKKLHQSPKQVLWESYKDKGSTKRCKFTRKRQN